MKNNNAYLEHANISVVNTEATIKLRIAAMPNWHVRGGGEMTMAGETIQWHHIGDNQSYIAVQSGGRGKVSDWKTSWTGVKHIGFVVPDLNSLIKRLADCGYDVDHFGGDHPYRKSAYFLEPHGIQFEFTEYLSSSDSERNDYSLPRSE